LFLLLGILQKNLFEIRLFKFTNFHFCLYDSVITYVNLDDKHYWKIWGKTQIKKKNNSQLTTKEILINEKYTVQYLLSSVDWTARKQTRNEKKNGEKLNFIQFYVQLVALVLIWFLLLSSFQTKKSPKNWLFKILFYLHFIFISFCNGMLLTLWSHWKEIFLVLMAMKIIICVNLLGQNRLYWWDFKYTSF
jgi:hypothetical protein